MRRVVSSVLAVASFALLSACEKKPDTSPAPMPVPVNAPTARATESAASPTPGADAASGAHDSHMANCPTAAPGATVAVKDVEGGVEISITGKDEPVTKEIRARMAKLVEADKNEVDAGVKHTSKGEGGGRYGRCTIVMRNTKLETTDITGGIKATVKAKDKTEVDWLRRETRDRDKEAKSPGSDAAGTHRMGHCPSAVEGAKTAIKETKEGVVVTVTGAGDAVKEIRERAKHTANVAKMTEPPKAEHNSEGKGGGGLGRCPVVVEGDTTVETKDVDNGVEITVKAKKDVVALQKETKLRAANFTGK